MNAPNEPTGSGAEVSWLRKLLRYCRSNEVVDSSDIRVSRGSHGTTLQLANRISPQSNATLRQFVLKEVMEDVYWCHELKGTGTTAQAGAEDFYIARPFTHRRTPFHNRSIVYNSDGDEFTATYSYESNTKRTKTVGGVAEVQIIIPLFKTDFDVIYAMECEQSTGLLDPDGEPVTLVEVMGEGRAWTKV